jgi:hypothetical protein
MLLRIHCECTTDDDDVLRTSKKRRVLPYRVSNDARGQCWTYNGIKTKHNGDTEGKESAFKLLFYSFYTCSRWQPLTHVDYLVSSVYV